MGPPNWQYTRDYDTPTYTIENVVDGMINYLRINLVAHVPLIQDAFAGDTVLHVSDNLRFEKFQGIAVFDDNWTLDPNTGVYSGIEFHEMWQHKTDSHTIVLKEPLKQNFLVSDHGRIQKSIKSTLLYEKDILYGDRAVIAFDHVAICVEPLSNTNEWMALGGLLSNEHRLSVIVYIKSGGLGEEEELAQRICNAYGDEVQQLLLNGIHLDLLVDEVPLRADGCIGQNYVVIGRNAAKDWPPDGCRNYEIQDNFHSEELHAIVPDHWPISSSSSETTCPSCYIPSSETSSLSSMTESSASSLSSSSTMSSSQTESGSSLSSQSSLSQSSSFSSDLNSASSSSLSSGFGGKVKVFLDSPLRNHYRVADGAKLRRLKRFFYDSRTDNVEYGTVQKGSVFLKAAVVSWFGKETNVFRMPQIGRGSPMPPK
jgi:hypothetical protein